MLLLSIVPTALFYFLNLGWLAIPWVPVALLGTATAFISGFRNTQTYNRTWEARQVYGAVINSSRSFGIMARDLVRTDDPERSAIVQQLIYRHMAWLTAMRYQLREVKPWENVKTKSYNKEYLGHYKVPEWETPLEEALKPFLKEEEYNYILSTKNRATQLLATQSAQLKELNIAGIITDYNYIAIEQHLKDLYDQQGKAERIKNFPYPRQFKSINMYFTNLLCLLLPLGFIGEFAKLADKAGKELVWLAVPASVIIGWVFLVLEQVGESTENPFEGNANDVSITQISRNIEIDLREMIGEQDLPPAIQAQNGILL